MYGTKQRGRAIRLDASVLEKQSASVVRKVSRFLHRLYGCASVRIIGAFLILNFSIPESVGTWSTVLKPIPVNDPTLKMAIGDDLPGIAGVVAVLMEQDGWPDSFATVGYSALVNAVQLGVAQA